YIDGVDYPEPHPSGYEVNPKTGEATKWGPINFSGFGAAGAMVTQLNDLLTWGKALGTGSLIGPALQQFRTSHSRPATDGPEYNRYGVGIGELKSWWGHTGEGLGAQAAVFYDPKSGSTIAVLVNSTQHVNAATEIFKALAPLVRHGRQPR
ncbi:MAG TPA: serine hydrolase, partial [Tepidisphaeraceae bacterium]|nr:serine hydrolase [Tepidisphaeraceae bacterium]